MRVRFMVLSVLLGCLALLLDLGPGRTQNPPARQRPPRPQRPAAPGASSTPKANEIDERFRQLDRDGDGVLSPSEMTEDLRAELRKWDVNGDCLIDLDEWRAYTRAVLAHQRRLAADAKKALAKRSRFKKPAGKPPVEGAARPPFNESFASRVGNRRPKRISSQVHKLPSNTPPWFKEYDADGDGQVSLFEWQQKGDDEREFWKYDLNKDGLITIEELLRSGQFTTDTNKMPPLQQIANRAQVGEFFYFEVTGTTEGSVWGTDIYTHSSLLSTAAVHAGVLRKGETGLVKVTILAGQSEYRATTRHGVTSHGFGGWPKSYRVEQVLR
jgi:Ca2+-binding EF-hand superfamily protein